MCVTGYDMVKGRPSMDNQALGNHYWLHSSVSPLGNSSLMVLEVLVREEVMLYL